MDKDTRWLRVQVPIALYDEIVRLAKKDDRAPHVYLRRFLEREFTPVVPNASDPFVPPQVFPSVQADMPVCLYDGVEPGTVTGLACPCPKCSTT